MSGTGRGVPPWGSDKGVNIEFGRHSIAVTALISIEQNVQKKSARCWHESNQRYRRAMGLKLEILWVCRVVRPDRHWD